MIGKMIAKKVLGTFAGGFGGAKTGYNNGEGMGNLEETKGKMEEASKIGSDEGKIIGGNADGNADSIKNVAEVAKGVFSDECLKTIYGDSCTDEVIKNFAAIDAIDFTYTPEAQKELPVDDREHFGVSAQNLESNPLTEGAVIENEDGIKMVNTNHLTTANTAVLSEVCKKLEDIEARLKFLEGK